MNANTKASFLPFKLMTISDLIGVVVDAVFVLFLAISNEGSLVISCS